MILFQFKNIPELLIRIEKPDVTSILKEKTHYTRAHF
jgi:hypothetical protein